MKLIKQSYEVLEFPNNLLEQVERAGRTCYKSEDKITKDSAAKFCASLIKRQHFAMIEFGQLTVRFITNRGVTHELVRHRPASYAQECVIGSTEIKIGSMNKTRTIEELYRQRNSDDPYDKTHSQTLRVKSVDYNSGIINNVVVDVFKKGEQEVFTVTTMLGYTITCSKNHRFLCPDGNYKALSELSVGSNVMVNGKSSCDVLPDTTLQESYVELGFAPMEIAEMYEVCYRTVVDRLKGLGIFEPRKNDKNPEKYNKNHTSESYEKGRQTILKQYAEGREVWNKGLSEHEHPSVKKQADALREHHHDGAPLGEKNGNWKGGIDRGTGYRKVDRGECVLCGATRNVEMHHKDGNHENNELSNLTVLCSPCHKKVHFGWHCGKKIHPDTIVSIESAGVQQTYDIEMAAPYHNYIADGFVTHNSTRYVKYLKGDMEFVQPAWWREDLDPRYIGLAGIAIETDQLIWKGQKTFLESCEHDELVYRDMMQTYGWKAQQAREVLPNALKTEIVVSANIRQWRHMFHLRTAPDAHPQFRALMLATLKDFKSRVHVLFDDL